MQRYVIAGLEVASELPMPAAEPSRSDSAIQTDVTIRMDERLRSVSNARFQNEWLEVGEQEFLLRPKKGLAFLVSNGREIIISRTSDITDGDVYLFLVGSVWGILCHQRRLLPLHCSAIELEGRAIAFTGPSGAGKSTLAAGLSKRGFLHICDDVCILDQSGGEVRLHPMPKGIKLWGDTTEALNVARGAAISSDGRWDKYYVSVPEYGGQEQLKISALYVLSHENVGEPGISQLRGSKRFEEVMRSLYRYEWLTMMREPADVFQQVAEVVEALRVFRFSRPWDMSRLDEGLQLLEGHMHRLKIEA